MQKLHHICLVYRIAVSHPTVSVLFPHSWGDCCLHHSMPFHPMFPDTERMNHCHAICSSSLLRMQEKQQLANLAGELERGYFKGSENIYFILSPIGPRFFSFQILALLGRYMSTSLLYLPMHPTLGQTGPSCGFFFWKGSYLIETAEQTGKPPWSQEGTSQINATDKDNWDVMFAT